MHFIPRFPSALFALAFIMHSERFKTPCKFRYSVMRKLGHGLPSAAGGNSIVTASSSQVVHLNEQLDESAARNRSGLADHGGGAHAWGSSMQHVNGHTAASAASTFTPEVHLLR